MSDPAQVIIGLKQEIEEAKREIAESKGGLQQVLKQIKDEFDVTTLKAAKILLDKKKKQLVVEEKTRDKLLKEFQEEWGEEDD